MPGESDNAMHPCLQPRTPFCDGCPLAGDAGYCHSWRNVAGRFDAGMKRKYSWRLNEDDRRDIISEAFTAILAGCRNIASLTAFPAWAWKILTNKLNDVLSGQGRTGPMASCRIPFPPKNIDVLTKSHSKYLSWTNTELTLRIVPSNFSRRVILDLIANAQFEANDTQAAEKWRRSLNRLHRYSRQPCFDELDDQQPDHGRSPEEQYDDVAEEEFFLKIFRARKGRQAENCISLIHDLRLHDHDRQRLAQMRSQADDALKQQISRCIRLCRKEILNTLSTITTSEGEFCFTFLSKLFESGDGIQQRIDKLASATGVSGCEIMSRIRRCRLLTLRTLEECHV